MSNSKRAKERRQKRSKLTKTQRLKVACQHFGDRGGKFGAAPPMSDAELARKVFGGIV